MERTDDVTSAGSYAHICVTDAVFIRHEVIFICVHNDVDDEEVDDFCNVFCADIIIFWRHEFQCCNFRFFKMEFCLICAVVFDEFKNKGDGVCGIF